ncbi:hypothetical protein Csa_017039 [Cucumis sativus]|nr:hypothetical protein Csa_017039 [Cucumis sativus]
MAKAPGISTMLFLLFFCAFFFLIHNSTQARVLPNNHVIAAQVIPPQTNQLLLHKLLAFHLHNIHHRTQRSLVGSERIVPGGPDPEHHA